MNKTNIVNKCFLFFLNYCCRLRRYTNHMTYKFIDIVLLIERVIILVLNNLCFSYYVYKSGFVRVNI